MITRKKALPFFMLTLSTILLFGAPQESAPVTNDQISIIFDMNGVLLQTSGTTRILGLKKFITYALTHNPLSMKRNLKTKLFELLNEIQEREPNEVDARDEQGNIIPQIMCNWMKGTQTCQHLRDAVDAQLANRAQNIETTILHDLAHMLFTPEKFAQSQYVVPEAVAFVKSLKEQGYKIYVLSNFCSPSFNIIKDENPEFFALFDGIVISGDIGLIKPDPTIYNYLLTAHNIDARRACFIDDQPTNVLAAQNVGIHSFVCPSKNGWRNNGSPDIESVKQEFDLWRETLAAAQLVQ
ncbi:MAG: HAD family hydrolase [Candidatus Babeliales bacterium]|nr:HAD family hydrolase [Candidatus Babeliales bacterium]